MKKLVTIGLSLVTAGMLLASPNDSYDSGLKRAIDSTNSLIMDNHFIKAGVSDDGTFGVNGNTKPGFELDPDGEGNYTFVKEDGTEVIPDYLTPGTPFEGFSIKFTLEDNSTVYKVNENSYTTDITESNITAVDKSTDGNITAVMHQAIVSEGATNYIEIKQLYTLVPGSTTLNIQVYLTNISDQTLKDVKYARFLDPDPDNLVYGDYYTKNQLGLNIETPDGNITLPSQNIAYALGAKTNMPVGLFTFDEKYEHNAVISPIWTKDPDKILLGGCDGDGDENATSCSYGDYAIGMAFKVNEIMPGETVVLNLGYLFGNSLAEAIESSAKAVLDKTFIDSLGLGWHLVGTSEAMLDMSIFDSADIVWVYQDGSWQWYTVNDIYKPTLVDSGFPEIKSIKPLSGIWVYKKEITIPVIETTTSSLTTDLGTVYMVSESEIISKKFDLVDDTGSTATVEFNSDNTATVVDPDGSTYDFTWSVDSDGKLLLTSSTENIKLTFYGPVEAGTKLYVEFGDGTSEVDTITLVTDI